MILKATPEMPEQAYRPGKAILFSIGSQASSIISDLLPIKNTTN